MPNTQTKHNSGICAVTCVLYIARVSVILPPPIQLAVKQRFTKECKASFYAFAVFYKKNIKTYFNPHILFVGRKATNRTIVFFALVSFIKNSAFVVTKNNIKLDVNKFRLNKN